MNKQEKEIEVEGESNKSEKEILLGKKKLRIFNLIDAIKDEKPYSNINPISECQQSYSDSEASDEEIEKYKTFISGKINIRNVLSNYRKNEEAPEKEKISLNKTNSEKSSDILSLLPAPKKNLSDKIQMSQIVKKKKPQNFFDIGEKFKDLANPDSDIMYNQKIHPGGVNTNRYNTTSNMTNINTYSFNVDDQIDKNWELKYLRKLEEKEEDEEFEEPTRQQVNKNHIKALISDHKKAKILQESKNQSHQSKYSKISTRNKYGW